MKTDFVTYLKLAEEVFEHNDLLKKLCVRAAHVLSKYSDCHSAEDAALIAELRKAAE